jgi:hypothetical protein
VVVVLRVSSARKMGRWLWWSAQEADEEWWSELQKKRVTVVYEVPAKDNREGDGEEVCWWRQGGGELWWLGELRRMKGGCHAKEMKQRCMGCRILDGDEEGAPFVADRNNMDKGRWSRVVTGDLVGGRSITGGWFSDRKPTRAGEGDDVVVLRRSPARMWLLLVVAAAEKGGDVSCCTNRNLAEVAGFIEGRDRGTSRWPVL